MSTFFFSHHPNTMKSIIIFAVLVATLFVMNGASGSPTERRMKRAAERQNPWCGTVWGYGSHVCGRLRKREAERRRQKRDISDTLSNIGENVGNGVEDFVKAWNQIDWGRRQKRDVSDTLRDVGENVGETIENISEHVGNGWEDLVKAWNQIDWGRRQKRKAEPIA